MLEVEERFVIRDMERKGLLISEIPRRRGHDRETIRRVIEGSLEPAPKARRRKKRKIAPYVPYLLKRIEAGVLQDTMRRTGLLRLALAYRTAHWRLTKASRVRRDLFLIGA